MPLWETVLVTAVTVEKMAMDREEKKVLGKEPVLRMALLSSNLRLHPGCSQEQIRLIRRIYAVRA